MYAKLSFQRIFHKFYSLQRMYQLNFCNKILLPYEAFNRSMIAAFKILHHNKIFKTYTKSLNYTYDKAHFLKFHTFVKNYGYSLELSVLTISTEQIVAYMTITFLTSITQFSSLEISTLQIPCTRGMTQCQLSENQGPVDFSWLAKLTFLANNSITATLSAQ